MLLELSLNISTVTGCIESDFPERMTYARLKRRPNELLVIDGSQCAPLYVSKAESCFRNRHHC
jgi:hypothetical protein